MDPGRVIVILITNSLILYFGIYGFLNLLFLIIFIQDFLRRKFREPDFSESPRVTVLVPSYNEEKVIVKTLEALLDLDYPNFEIIAIDDGSEDDTSERVIESFGMKPCERKLSGRLKTRSILKTYVSDRVSNLTLVKKENGGKSDALNAGINYASGDIIVTIDADTILAPGSLRRIVEPFLKGDAAAVGGLLTLSNGVKFRGNRPISADVPGKALLLFQLIEYLVSYTIGRVALSRLNSLLVLSGAFSAFDRDLLLEIGGFLSYPAHGKHTVCEDMEVIIRLHRFLKEKKIDRKILFEPFPVAWTEAPSDASSVLKQRNRWHRGLAESLISHREMLFEPRYGRLGLFAVPYYFLFEFLAPAIKVLSLIFLVLLALMKLVHLQFVIALFLFAVIVSALYTALLTTLVEYKFKKISKENIEALRYRNFASWLKLVTYSFVLEPAFGLLRLAGQLWGIYDFLRGSKDWYKYERETA